MTLHEQAVQATFETLCRIQEDIERDERIAREMGIPLVKDEWFISQFLPPYGLCERRITRQEVETFLRYSVAINHEHRATTYMCRTADKLISVTYGQRQNHGYLRVEMIGDAFKEVTP